jgi:hypothetical protein
MKPRESKSKSILTKVVFSIDDLLATQMKSHHRDDEWMPWFDKRKLTITVSNKKVFLHPGTIELMRYLASLPSLEICFFSQAHKKINCEFVDKLFNLALGADGYQQYIKSHGEIRIFSAHHLIESNGSYKKDLNLIVKSEKEALETTMIIDNEASSLYTEHLMNGLLVAYTQGSTFNAAHDKDIDAESRNSSIYSANVVFFIAGVIESLFECEDRSLKSYLNSLQYNQSVKRSIDGLTVKYQRKVGVLSHNKELFLKGHSVLSSFNLHGELSFFGCEADKIVELPAKKSENTVKLTSITSSSMDAPSKLDLVSESNLTLFSKPETSISKTKRQGSLSPKGDETRRLVPD